MPGRQICDTGTGWAKKREGVSLSLLITKEKELSRDTVANSSFGCCDHETVDFNVLRKAKDLRLQEDGCWFAQDLKSSLP